MGGGGKGGSTTVSKVEIPPEVLASLPSRDQIREKAAQAQAQGGRGQQPATGGFQSTGSAIGTQLGGSAPRAGAPGSAPGGAPGGGIIADAENKLLPGGRVIVPLTTNHFRNEINQTEFA